MKPRLRAATRVILVATFATTGLVPLLYAGDQGAVPPSTVVVTHGFQLSGSIPAWPFAMANAIAGRAEIESGTNGRILVYDGASGDLNDCQHAQCSVVGTGTTVIVFNWAADSNESGSGFSEAAAESLFAGLVQWSQQDPSLVNLDALHLIGHSRGAIVNSEVGERLIAAGFPGPVQVTSLDPHDSGGSLRSEEGTEGDGDVVADGGLDDYDVNQEHPEYNCHAQNVSQGVCAWVGVDFQDNYWQNDPGCFSLLPDGLELFGSANLNQNALDDPFCHSETHRWYLLTADTQAATHPVTGNPPGPDWYGVGTNCTASPRPVALARDTDGFNFSALAGGESTRCPTGPGTQQIVLFDFALQEGFVNGDFERNPSGGAESGWSFHGGGLQATTGTDTDRFLRISGGEWARHNRFFVPNHASGLQICKKVAASSTSDTLSLIVEIPGSADREMLLGDQQSLTSTSDWTCFEAPFLASEVGRTAQILLSVTNNATPEVHIDDIRLLTQIFSDGFESGNTSSWTNQSP